MNTNVSCAHSDALKHTLGHKCMHDMYIQTWRQDAYTECTYKSTHRHVHRSTLLNSHISIYACRVHAYKHVHARTHMLTATEAYPCGFTEAVTVVAFGQSGWRIYWRSWPTLIALGHGQWCVTPLSLEPVRLSIQFMVCPTKGGQELFHLLEGPPLHRPFYLLPPLLCFLLLLLHSALPSTSIPHGSSFLSSSCASHSLFLSFSSSSFFCFISIS